LLVPNVIRIYHGSQSYNLHYHSYSGKTKDKSLTDLSNDGIIHSQFKNDEKMKFLTYAAQIHKFKSIQYYIVYDIETMEELIDNQGKDLYIEMHDNLSSSAFSSTNIISNLQKSTRKIYLIILLSDS
jgi:hypothetical protein